MSKIGVLIPVYNKLSYTQNCLSNLNQCFTGDQALSNTFEIIVIDDASTDGTSAWIIKNHKEVHLLQGSGNLWWSGGINVGAKYAIDQLKCKYLLLWNNDIEVERKFFINLLELIKTNNENIIIGAKIYADLENRIVWSMGGRFNPKNGRTCMIGYMSPDADPLNSPVEADWLTGMGTTVPSAIVKKIGYWDEENYPQYLGDMEFTYRANTYGYRNIAFPEIVIWNDTKNTGWTKKDSLRTVFRMLSDKRSLYYLRANIKFYTTYSESLFAYSFLLYNYFKFIGGFFKWKLLKIIGFKGKSEFNVM